MGLKFDSVMSPEFSKMKPQALIRLRDCKFAATPRRFQVQKRSQFFVRAHNEALIFVAMCISDEDRSRIAIHACPI